MPDPTANLLTVPCPRCFGDGSLQLICTSAACDYTQIVEVDPTQCADVASLRARLAAVEQERDTLRTFAVWVIEQMRDGSDLEGGEIQEQAVMLGLLQLVHVTVPCGGHCSCADFDNIPGECFRESGLLAAAATEEG